MDYHVQVRTRGIIPSLLKRGPLADIILDEEMIRDLVSRGVDIVSVPDGIPMEEVLNRDTAEETPVVEEAPAPVVESMPISTSPEPITVPAPVVEPLVTEEVVTETTTDDMTDDEKDESGDIVIMKNPDGTPMSKNQMKKARRAAAQAANGTHES